MTPSTITVPSGLGSIQDVNVLLQFDHTWLSDLIITVNSPQGTARLLHNGGGGSADANGVYVFDDSGSVTLEGGAGSPRPSGTYLPIQALSGLAGQDPTGDWVLNIYDQYGGDIGMLYLWEVIITPGGKVVLVPKKRAPRAYNVVDWNAINSAVFRGLPMALAQRRVAMASARVATRDLNARLLRARAEAGSDSPRLARMKLGPAQYAMAETDAAGGYSGPSFLDRLEVFVAGDYAAQDLNTMGDEFGSRSETLAGTAGLEYLAAVELALGLGLTSLDGETEVSEQVGTVDACGMSLSPYVTWVRDTVYADLMYSYGSFEHEIRRKTGLGDIARADPDARTHSLSLNTGYGFLLGQAVTGPMLGLEYLEGKVDGYTERNGGSAGIKVDEQTFDSLVSKLGWQATCPVAAPRGMTMQAQVRAAWHHEFADDAESVTADMLNSPFTRVRGSSRTSYGSYSYTTYTGRPKRDFLGVGAGVLVELTDDVRLVLDYEAELLRGEYSAHYGSIRLGISI